MTTADRRTRLSTIAGLSFGLPRAAARIEPPAWPIEPGARSVLPTVQSGQPAAALQVTTETSACWAEAVLAGSRDILLVLEEDCSIRIANAATHRVLGLRPSALVGAPVIDLVHPEDAERAMSWLARVNEVDQPLAIELRCRHADGGWVEFEAAATAMLDVRAVNGIVLSLHYVGERKALEAELNHWAYHDPLTNLANRTQLRERISNALDRSSRSGSKLAVLLIDLDDFKQVNDSLGHREGDQMLVTVAERLRGCVSSHDTVARLSGDEFVVLMPDLPDEAAADALAERIRSVLDAPIMLAEEQVILSASIGIRVAAGELSGCDTEQILRDADLAMYAAKAAGKGCWRRFRPAMHELAREQLSIRSALRRAIADEQFVLRYQPIVALDSLAVIGFEALIRWRHPDRGLISPDQFISTAESSGLIVPIGAWVVQTACRAAAQLRRLADRDLTMSVNVSPRQLLSDDIIDVVAMALAEAGLPASALCLEITESVLADEAGLIERLRNLRALGVHLAIDDFGTGFSSYAHLQRLPIDTIKIDRSFIEPLAADEASPALARSIIPMCEGLGLRTVAEGVETVEQYEQLRDLRCQYAQGYLFDRPLEYADAVDALLASVARAQGQPG